MTNSLRGLSVPKGQAFLIVTAIFLVLILIVAGLRVQAKRIVKRRFEIHDYLAVAALVLSTGFAVLCFLCVYLGTVGMHTRDAIVLGPGVMIMTLKMIYASGFLWITATTLIKMSLLHFYRGLFINRALSSSRAKALLYVAHGVYALALLYWIAHITLLLRICQPISLEWNSTQSGHCGDINTLEVSSSSVNMILDGSIFVLPMPALWSLPIPPGKKTAVNVLLSLGLCICVINIARVVLLAKSGSADSTYRSADVGLLSGLEIYIGFICASLPTLGPLLRKDRLAAETRNRKYHMSRNRAPSGKPSKKILGDNLLLTTRFFEPLEDEVISVEDGSDVRNHEISISMAQEIHVSVDKASDLEMQQPPDAHF